MFMYTLNSFILMQPPTNGHLEQIAELLDNAVNEIQNGANNAELKLFLEVEFSPDLRPLVPPEKTKDEILLFFKLYDPVKEELRFVGRSFVKAVGKPTEILRSLNEMAGFSPNEEIELFEEIKFEPNVMCEHVDKRLTFRGSQLEDGDIICFQKVLLREDEERYRYPDVPSFLEYVHNRQEEVAKEFGIPIQFQRFWLWEK